MKALYEVQNGKITKTSGTYIQEYSLNKNSICRLSSYNKNHGGFDDNKKYCLPYIFVPTIENGGYYLVKENSSMTNATIQFSADFKTITKIQFNGLDTHFTIWHGKALF